MSLTPRQRGNVIKTGVLLPRTSAVTLPPVLSNMVLMAITPENYLVYRDEAGDIFKTNLGASDLAGKAGEYLPDKSFVYLDIPSGLWYLQDTDANPIKMSNPRGVCNYRGGIQPNETGLISISGIVSGYSGLIPGAAVYASTIAGAYTQVKPVPLVGQSQVAIALMGYAVNTTSMSIQPGDIVYQKRVSLASLATTTITHHSDPSSKTREPRVYLSSNLTALAQSYASGNQDALMALRGPSGAGGVTAVNSNGTSNAPIGGLAVNNTRIAQSFQVTAGRLSQITFNLGPNVGVLGGAALSWSVQTDNGGVPSGTVIVGDTIASPLASAQNTITIGNGPVLQASITYWFVLQAPTLLLGNYYQVQYNSSGGYSNGALKSDTAVLGMFQGNWTQAVYGANADMRMSVTTSAVPAADRLAQSFQVQSNVSVDNIKLYLDKKSTPAGTLTLALYSDSGGVPGSPLANGTANTVAASSLSSSLTLTTFTFPNAPALSANVTYWMVLSTTDTASASHYVEWGIDQSTPTYAYGEMKIEVSSVWVSTAPASDGVFEVYSVNVTLSEGMILGRYTNTVKDADTFGWIAGAADASGTTNDTQTSFRNRTSGTLTDVTLEVRVF